MVVSMNREDIIRMAQEAGFRVNTTESLLEELERFAELVASAEREACAELTDSRCQCGGLIQSRGQA
jgi:hypothetical protein